MPPICLIIGYSARHALLYCHACSSRNITGASGWIHTSYIIFVPQTFQFSLKSCKLFAQKITRLERLSATSAWVDSKRFVSTERMLQYSCHLHGSTLIKQCTRCLATRGVFGMLTHEFRDLADTQRLLSCSHSIQLRTLVWELPVWFGIATFTNVSLALIRTSTYPQLVAGYYLGYLWYLKYGISA